MDGVKFSNRCSKARQQKIQEVYQPKETRSRDEVISNPQELQSSGGEMTQLFLGGMASTTNLTALQSYLRAISSPDSGLYISIVRRLKRKTFSGYGTIKNISLEDAERLLYLGNFKFEGCWYGVKPFLKKKSAINSLRSERNNKKIYIKGIQEWLNEVDLERYFSRFGEVLHVQIGKHQDSGHYKGFGFVEFQDSKAADLAAANPNHLVNGSELRCEKSKLHKPARLNSEKGGFALDRAPFVHREKEKRDFIRSYELTKDRPSGHLALVQISRMSPEISKNHGDENLLFRVVRPSQRDH